MSNDSSDFLNEAGGGESHPAVKFETVNDGIKGTIVDPPKPVMRKNLNDGSPEKQLPINLDPGDGNVQTLWVRPVGFLVGAIKDAVAESKSVGLEVGGVLAVQFIESRDTGKPKPARVFRAKYTPPAPAAVSITDVFDD